MTLITSRASCDAKKICNKKRIEKMKENHFWPFYLPIDNNKIFKKSPFFSGYLNKSTRREKISWLGPESLKSILFLSMPIWEVFCKIYVRSPFQELHCNRATFDPKDFCNLFIFKWVVYPNYSINGRLQAGKVLKSTNELQN